MIPDIGAYLLYPFFMAYETNSINKGSLSESGNPFERLIALCSFAKELIIVKFVVLTLGSLELKFMS